MTKTHSYHKKCFSCIKCKHQMEAGNFAHGPEGEVYCKSCYESTHGRKAPTKSMPLDTTSIQAQVSSARQARFNAGFQIMVALSQPGDKRKCPRCSGKVFEAEKMVSDSGWYHRHCFRCNLCTEPLDSLTVCEGPDSKIYCRYVRANKRQQKY